MTMSALTVAVLVAWPAINVLLGGYAAWLATAGERRRPAGAGPDGGACVDRQCGKRDCGKRDCGDLACGDLSCDGTDCGADTWHAATSGSCGLARGDEGRSTPRVFWIVVPCLNEDRVVANTVRSALALCAPDAQTRVLVVDDASDDDTQMVVGAIHSPRLSVLRRELPEARLGKGAALNAAYQYIGQWAERASLDPSLVVIGVIDGDGRGSQNLLTEVSAAMADPRIGAVQARVRIHNRNRLLGAVQDLEFGCVADASQMVRDRIGSVGLGGNGQFTRLSTLLDLGPVPWSDCLVEDLELGLRLHLAGVGIAYVWRASITQQGVVDVRRLLRQRTRWAQGNLQCIRYLPQLAAARDIRNHTYLEMCYYLLAPWLNALGSVLIVGLWAYAGYLVVVGGAPVAADSPVVGMAIWLLLLVLPGLTWAVAHRLRLRDEALGRCLIAGMYYPVFLLLGLVSTWRAVGRQLTGRHGWVKTERLVEEPTPVLLP